MLMTATFVGPSTYSKTGLGHKCILPNSVETRNKKSALRSCAVKRIKKFSLFRQNFLFSTLPCSTEQSWASLHTKTTKNPWVFFKYGHFCLCRYIQH